MAIMQMMITSSATPAAPAEFVGGASVFKSIWYVPLEVVLPLGIQAGDLIVLVGAGADITGISENDYSLGFSSSNARVYHKIADGDESGNEVGINTSFGSEGQAAGCFVFRNAVFDSADNDEPIPSHVFPAGGGFSFFVANNEITVPSGWTQVGSGTDRTVAYRQEIEGSSALTNLSYSFGFAQGYVHSAG